MTQPPDTTPATGWIEADVAGSLLRRLPPQPHCPPISQLPDNVVLWRLSLSSTSIPWLFYTLQRLRLPLATRIDNPEHGLAFDFLAESRPPTGPKVLTGHDNGLITIALEEADDAERERRRTQMGEPYRSLLGHFRHEVGHYFLGCAGA